VSQTLSTAVVLLLALSPAPIGEASPIQAAHPPAGAAVRAGDVAPESLWHELGSSNPARRAADEPSDLPLDESLSRAYRLDEPALAALLSRAPLEGTESARQAGLVVPLPLPDGSFGRFRVEESPIIVPELVGDYPELRAYAGRGVDDPTATMRCDLTPAGFRAMIISASGTVYVDPYRRGDTTRYVSYDKRGYRGKGRDFRCLSPDGGDPEVEALEEAGKAIAAATGDVRRTYRLSIATTAQYSQYHGGNPAAAVFQTVNRINLIFQRELSIGFLWAPNPAILFTAEPDGFSNGDVEKMIDQNQTKHDAVVGSANYDIGHVFGTTGGSGEGMADKGVCQAGLKARGVSCDSDPEGVFDVDFVAHEIGHQFGASHTFNATTSGCSGNKVASSAYEPGSGTTIMSYAGACGANDVADNADDYFHVKSYQQIVAYTTGSLVKNCPEVGPTSNTPPSVNAGVDFTIPRETPFTLTATGQDTDGDALTYCWEQYDLGADTDNAKKPLFRSRYPSEDRRRGLPDVYDLWVGSPSPWEKLPTVDRTMKFRCTVRDGFGGAAFDEVKVTVAGSPFKVTYPNTATTWPVGATRIVTWKVESPKIAQSVDVWLWHGDDYVSLAAGVPNDGSQAIKVPNTPGTECRVLVQAHDATFYDVGDADFTIVAPALGETVEGGAAAWTSVSSGGSEWFVETTSGSLSGTKRFAIGVLGSGYLDDTNASLTSPSFSLLGKSSATLSFYFKHKTEAQFDKLWVEVSTDGGGTWTQVGPTRSSQSTGWPNWVLTSISLTPYVNKSNVRIRFRFTSDDSFTSWGAALDDVFVVAH
jgi:hypothetical protein